MEDFQRELNQNRDGSRRMKWEKHRIHVTGLFNQVFLKKGSVDKVAIFGAGNCDDLDVDYLASKCNEIYLFDIDMDSMKRGMQHFSESTCNKIKLIQLDVTGLDQIHFEQQLSSLLESGAKAEEIVQLLKDTEQGLAGLVEEQWANYRNMFDIVATSAIYTQLFYNWALDTLSAYEDSYNGEEVGRIKESFLDVRDEIILSFHDSVRQCCRQNGFFIMWSDILQMEPQYIETINQGPNAILALASNIGYGAALIAIQDFMGHVEKNEFSLTYWPWDFHEDKQYVTMGLLGKVIV